MKIGLIDVDGHNFPNLALMRISSYHKAKGDTVEWWWSDFVHYDIVYKSKIFSDDYSKDVPDPINADRVIKGGTGYAIHLVDGKEVFDKDGHENLPSEIESCFPDYSIYPQFDFAVSMTSRGCPRGCWFCHNQGVEQLRLLRKNYPELWKLMLKWDGDSPVTFHADGHIVHDFDARFALEDEGLISKDERWSWSYLNAVQLRF